MTKRKNVAVFLRLSHEARDWLHKVAGDGKDKSISETVEALVLASKRKSQWSKEYRAKRVAKAEVPA